MQFLAQVPLAEHDEPDLASRDQVLLLFQCQADPGMCDEWDADAGGNAAILVAAAGRESVDVPAGETLLPGCSPVTFEDGSDPDYQDAVAAREEVLGKLGGSPLWVQGDETPSCSCGAPMRFVVQLEDRGGGGINFGDAGVGYAFICADCSDRAKFLWQCG